MTTRGVAFLKGWIAKNVTTGLMKSMNRDAASLSTEMADRLVDDAARAGFLLDDLQPEFGTPEELIRKALENDETSQNQET